MMTEAVAAVVAVAETSNYRQVSDNAGIRMNMPESARGTPERMDIQAENSSRSSNSGSLHSTTRNSTIIVVLREIHSRVC